MNLEYLNFECIKKMNDTYKMSFENIVKEYGEKINCGVVHEGGVVFTLHDFDHHCCDLYYIISDVILYKGVVFGNSDAGITEKELYLLNLAVLLHDLGMLSYVTYNRDDHAVKSSEDIKEAYANNSDPLSCDRSGLCPNEIVALRKIVKAHSDIKGINVPKDNGLDDTTLTNSMEGVRGQTIRARLLANILRIADELDITNNRLGKLDAEKELDKAVTKKRELQFKLENEAEEEQKKIIGEQIKRYEAAEISRKHWKRLHLFKAIKRNSSGVVQLVVDDNYIEEYLEVGNAIEGVADEIEQIYDKIYNEFERFKRDIEKEVTFTAMIAMKDIQIETQNDELKKALQEHKKKDKKEKKDGEHRKQPSVISEDVQKKITTFVEKRGLYEVGHFRLHDNLCARDWITVDEVIETNHIFRKCEEQFLIDLRERMRNEENYLIVGIDFCGMLIASKLAFVLQKPYTYVVPSHKIESSSQRELGFFPEEYDKIILVTDVVVTFATIRNIIKEYNISSKINAIYAVFFRDTKEQKYIKENQDLVGKTYVLNKNFNIELQTNDACRYRDCEECKAANRRYK